MCIDGIGYDLSMLSYVHKEVLSVIWYGMQGGQIPKMECRQVIWQFNLDVTRVTVDNSCVLLSTH